MMSSIRIAVTSAFEPNALETKISAGSFSEPVLVTAPGAVCVACAAKVRVKASFKLRENCRAELKASTASGALARCAEPVMSSKTDSATSPMRRAAFTFPLPSYSRASFNALDRKFKRSLTEIGAATMLSLIESGPSRVPCSFWAVYRFANVGRLSKIFLAFTPLNSGRTGSSGNATLRFAPKRDAISLMLFGIKSFLNSGVVSATRSKYFRSVFLGAIVGTLPSSAVPIIIFLVASSHKADSYSRAFRNAASVLFLTMSPIALRDAGVS